MFLTAYYFGMVTAVFVLCAAVLMVLLVSQIRDEIELSRKSKQERRDLEDLQDRQDRR